MKTNKNTTPDIGVVFLSTWKAIYLKRYYTSVLQWEYLFSLWCYLALAEQQWLKPPI